MTKNNPEIKAKWERDPNTIYFFKASDPETGYLSNFYEAPFEIDGLTINTVEHYFQASKFGLKSETGLEIIKQPKARMAARIGRTVTPQTNSEEWHNMWKATKVEVMYRGLYEKFRQNKELCDRLLATGNATIVERSDSDSFWGDGRKRKGVNKMGRLLMKLREEFRMELPVTPDVDDSGFKNNI
jgi:hypothetical protein